MLLFVVNKMACDGLVMVSCSKLYISELQLSMTVAVARWVMTKNKSELQIGIAL
jgi:hypothetical protein